MQTGPSADSSLLTPSDGPPVEVINPSGAGEFLLVCEHASHRMPASLGDLGLNPELLDSHIAWDPGALAVAKALSGILDAPLVAGRFSRLAYDCNRPPEARDAIVSTSEDHPIPGNQNLDETARAAREQEIYAPFRAALETEVSRRPDATIITVHSFTPVFRGQARGVELGVLHDADARLADAVLERAANATGLRTERNEPYGPEDGVTHTLRQHALSAELLNVMLEIRSDLISDEASCRAMAASLAQVLSAANEAVRTSDATTATGTQRMPEIIKRYVRVVDRINHRVGRFAMYLIFLMMAILLWSSISKTFFSPTLWTLEMAQFTMVAFYILGGPYSIQLGSNVRMDLFYGDWSPRRKAWFDAFTVLFLIFYLAIMLYGGLGSTAYSFEYGERSSTAWRPFMWPIKTIMCVGLALMILQATSEFFKDLARIRGVQL